MRNFDDILSALFAMMDAKNEDTAGVLESF